MSDKRKCIEAIRQIATGTDTRPILCQVKEVDGYTCTVLTDTGVELKNIKLNAAIEDKKGLLITPKKDSKVWVSMSDELNGFVCMYSDIEKAEITLKLKRDEKGEICETEKPNIIIIDGKITINGGDNFGLVRIEALTEKLNDLVELFRSHTHAGVITATSIQVGQLVTAITADKTGEPVSKELIMDFDKDDYENTNFTH